MTRHVYELEGQTLRLLRDRAAVARSYLNDIARDAGDVDEWNIGGPGYRAIGLLDDIERLIGQLLKEGNAS